MPVTDLAAKRESGSTAAKPLEPAASVMEVSLTPGKSELKVGDKQQLQLRVKSDAPLGLALVTLRFDPKVLKVNSISMGDLFLNRSSPAMDDGSVESWIQALDHVLGLPVENVVPGHFELATKSDLKRFRDYMNDLYQQVKALKQKNETVEQVRRDIQMEKYSDFRQYPKYEATFGDNAAVIYQQLQAH